MAEGSVRLFIEAEINKTTDRQPTYKKSKLLLRCPNPQHSGGHERTPSCEVSLEGKYAGRFRCFGCHEKGNWNTLVDWTRATCGVILNKLDLSIDNSHERSLKFKQRQFTERPVAEQIDFANLMRWPENEDWRGISGTVLRNTLDARLIKRSKQYRLVLPAYIHKEMVGYIEAVLKPRINKDGSKELSYINSSGAWSEKSLYNYDNARRSLRDQPLWVVEGPRDTANIVQHGGRVVGLMGSAVTKAKVELIKGLNPPLIVSATDNDDAGNHAHHMLVEELSEWYRIIRYKFSDGRDPADMSRREVQRVIAKATEKVRRS